MIFKGFKMGMAAGAFVLGFSMFYGTSKAVTKYVLKKFEENVDEEDSNSDDNPGSDDASKSKG